MSKYISYAIRIDEEVKTRGAAFQMAMVEFRNAKEKFDRTTRECIRTGKRDTDIELLKSKIAMQESENAFAEAKAALSNIGAAINQITAQFKNKLEEDNRATAKDIEEKDLELLKSGIMRYSDFVKMSERFQNNATMLKIMAKYARESAENSTDKTEKMKLNMFFVQNENGIGAKMREWDNLIKLANEVCNTERPNDLIYRMLNHWNDENEVFQKAVLNF